MSPTTSNGAGARSDTVLGRRRSPRQRASRSPSCGRRIHLTLNGARVKSLRSHLSSRDLTELVGVLDAKLAVLKAVSPGADLTALRDHFICAFLAKEQVM
jgi:hypothetical protein